MKNILSILLCSFLLLSSSCSKNEEPECTPVDLIANSNGIPEISCTVNGKYWEAYAPFYLPGSIQSRYDKEKNRFGFGGNLRIYGNESNHPCFNKGDTIFQSFGVGCIINNLRKNRIDVSGYNFSDFEGKCSKTGNGSGYEIDTTQPHYIEFVEFDTSDSGSQWAVGTFEFDAINVSCGDTVSVRDGRFEVLK